MTPGSWIADGTIGEEGFESATGVDVSGDRPIDNAVSSGMDREQLSFRNGVFFIEISPFFRADFAISREA